MLNGNRLRASDISRFYTKAQKEGRMEGKGGLSKRTVLQIHRILWKALQQAVRFELQKALPGSIRTPKPLKLVLDRQPLI